MLPSATGGQSLRKQGVRALITRSSKKDELWEEVERLRSASDSHRNRAAVLESESQQLRDENSRLAKRTEFIEQLTETVRSANEKLEILTSLTKELASFDLDGVLEVSVKRIPYLVGARYASVYLFERKKNRLTLKQHTHEHDINAVVHLDEVPDSLMATAVRTKQTLCIGDLGGYTSASGETPPRPHQKNYTTNSCVVAPLIAAGEVEGVLNLTDRFDQRPFDVNSHAGASQLKVIRQACELVAVSLRNARLFEQVQRAARTCSLTGLRNHQAYTEILDIEVRRATRYANKLAIIAFRVHGVGLLNANWGHQAGDQLLKTVADHLRANIRDVDIAGRTGGTEFGVILPEQAMDGALVVAERLAELFNDLRVKIGDAECQVSATFGVVEFAAEGTGPELLHTALERQKQAREAGERLRSE